MSSHWNPEEELQRVRRVPARPASRAVALAEGWSDNRKAALVLAAGLAAWVAAGLFQVVGP
jgi:hypothetical protein